MDPWPAKEGQKRGRVGVGPQGLSPGTCLSSWRYRAEQSQNHYRKKAEARKGGRQLGLSGAPDSARRADCTQDSRRV